MSKFRIRLRELRIGRELSQQMLADALGISKSSINMYERGEREPGLETLEAIADHFGVGTDYLLGKTEDPGGAGIPADAANVLPLPPTRSVPLLGEIACGQPLLARENFEDHVRMPREVQADFCLRCKGDSMNGARIRDGDIVFIRQQPDVENGEIAAVLIDNEATLKRVYKYPGKMVLGAENPAFAPLIYTGEELAEVRILGRAVAFLSQV